MRDFSFKNQDKVLVLGATGFVGSRLAPELWRRGIMLRLLVRNPEKLSGLLPEGADAEIMKGDLLRKEGLREAVRGIHTVYYLVHSMGGKTLFQARDFIKKDRQAAENFMDAAEAEGVKRVVYLGGLGEAGSGLSEHLKSRKEVADILSSRKQPAATILRAAVIIGAGGASFEILRYLVERLPVMVCPRWINTRIQPIAIQDVLEYLIGCLKNPETVGGTFDIGGPEVLTYRQMMDLYADARGLVRRRIIIVPFLTPGLSAYWVDLVTPIPPGVAHPLIEGMKNDVVCRDYRIRNLIPINLTPFKEAVRLAFSEEKSGPGITGF